MSSSAAYQPSPHRLSVEDLTRMVAAGIVREDARVELIEGELIDMPPIHAPHAGIVGRLSRLLFAAIGDRGVVWVQNPLRLSELSLPQPDLEVLRPRPDDYTSRLPNANDVLLVIEVSDSTLGYDRDRKLPLYATRGVPEAWLVDVTTQTLTRYRDPSLSGYGRSDQPTGTLAPQRLPQCRIEVAAIFPGRPSVPARPAPRGGRSGGTGRKPSRR